MAHGDEHESMAEVLSSVLGGASTRQRPALQLSRKKLLVIVAVPVVLTMLIVGTLTYLTHRSAGPIPTSITKSLAFPVYYPRTLPSGFVYQKGSAKNTSGILFYVIGSGSQKLFVSEQASPAVAPPLDGIPGFTKIETAQGTALSGKNGEEPAGLLSTTATLVTVTGSGGVDLNTLNTVLKSLVNTAQ